MKQASIHHVLALVAVLTAAAGSAVAEEPRKSIATIVATESPADGTSQIHTEVLEECIMTLPTLEQLQPVTDARSEFLKAINGDIENNASTRTFSATVSVTYSLYQKKLVVVTANTVEKSEPVLREVDGRFDQSVVFESNPENGDSFAGRDLVKEYYFSTPEGAAADAMRKAEAWIKQKQALLCGPDKR